MRRTFILCFGLIPVVALAELGACSNGTSGTGPVLSEDASSADVSSDAVPDATLPTEAGEAATPLPDASEAGQRDVGASEDAAPETGPDSGPDTGADGATDAPNEGAVDAGTEAGCAGVICNGQCIASSDCTACVGAPLLCAPTGHCGASCQTCTDPNDAGLPIECFACDSTHHNPIGTCQPNDSNAYCLSGNYLGQYDGGAGYQCGCTDVTSCPGATQVCVPLGNGGNSFCLTCGETTLATIDGLPCHDGGACNAGAAACQ